MVCSGLPCAAAPLIPHRPPMALLSRLLRCSENEAEAEALVEAGHLWLEEDGRLRSEVLVELMAQTSALMNGYLDRRRGQAPRQGMLVGFRRLQVLAPVQAPALLLITMETVGEMDGFAIAQGLVTCNGTRIAEGSIKVWVPPSGQILAP